ncbi:MAG: helix-turn-helix domain-containing protein [Desulfoprunum sp.]|nr:excisionase [Desulfobulbus sp. Tol-SR]
METIKNARATDKLLTQEQAAELLGVLPKTLQAWRTTQRYPLKFVKVGRCVRYRLQDLADFIEKRTFTGM